MTILTSRRSVLGGLAAALAAPAVVRASSLMPVRRTVVPARGGIVFMVGQSNGIILNIGDIVRVTEDGCSWHEPRVQMVRIVDIVEADRDYSFVALPA